EVPITLTSSARQLRLWESKSRSELHTRHFQVSRRLGIKCLPWMSLASLLERLRQSHLRRQCTIQRALLMPRWFNGEKKPHRRLLQEADWFESGLGLQITVYHSEATSMILAR